MTDLTINFGGFNSTTIKVEGNTPAGRDFIRKFVFGPGCTLPVTGAEIFKSDGFRFEQELVHAGLTIDGVAA